MSSLAAQQASKEPPRHKQFSLVAMFVYNVDSVDSNSKYRLKSIIKLTSESGPLGM